jgi:SAM-dependent methyltransferase
MTVSKVVKSTTVGGTEQSEFSSRATEEMIGLLRVRDGEQRPLAKSGYVDVLAGADAIGPHRGQQVFRKRIVVLVYERIWRPLVSRFFFGLRGPRAKAERQMTVNMLQLAPGDRVIDVGCGPGNYTRSLGQATGDGLVVGIDASEAMVAAAARRGGGANLAYLRGDGSALPFAEGQFDGACCVGVIHLIEDPMAALDEIVRVLSPGGRLAIAATCGREGAPARVRGGMTIFARNELVEGLSARGCVEIDQRIIGRGQIISARKPLGGHLGS